MIRRAFFASLLLAIASCGRRDNGGFRRPEQPPTRIVAGSVLAAETLLEIAPRERIAAVHTFAANAGYSLIADAVAGLPLVGAEPEQLISVRPDLVIVDAFTKPETLAILMSAGVPVLRTAAPKSFEDIAANIRRIGHACHLEDAADRLVVAMNAELARLAQRGADLGSWQVMALDGQSHTYGRGSLFDAVVGASGAKNLAASRGAGPFRKLTTESVLAWRPPVLVIDMQSGSEELERSWLDQSPGFELLPALANDRVIFMPTALFGTTSHHLVDAVAFVQDALHRWGPQ